MRKVIWMSLMGLLLAWVAGSGAAMKVDELLGRLERVRKTKDGWQAQCPAHGDKTPSLSIGVGGEGQILVRCFAGCTPEAIVEVLGLRMADLFPEKGPAPPLIRRASDLPPVAEWLRTARGLPAGEVNRMFAIETSRGPAVVFRYTDAEGRTLYDKYRSLSAKRFWRRPPGTASALYGLRRLASSAPERAIVVEGELDAHALWARGIEGVVSVPDGCGSRLTPELLAPLGPFRHVVIATDADGPGDELAARLANALNPERCLRLRLDYERGGKDANDCLRAGWTREQFEARLEAATPMTAAAPVASTTAATELARRYQVIEGRTCYIRTDRKGNDLIETLANFSAFVEEEITFDDGAEVRREFRLAGKLADGEALSAARVSAAEFSSLTWVTREWGIRAVVSAGTGTKDHLRTAIQHLSTPKRRRVFRHTGWIEHEGRDVFLYQGGAVGAAGLEVDLPPPLDRFVLPSQVTDVREAVRTSLRLLDCAPLEVTAPLLASVYVAPVATILNPDVTVWLHGASGSMKSTLSALAQGHFGDFDRKTLSATWTSTENALENRLFILKDVLSVIDDYAPQADQRAQRELDRRVQRVLRNVGNRAGRGRLTAELTQRPERPPRGFLLCNGEELPPGVSINARLVPVEIERSTLDLTVITSLQERGALLREAMRGYLEWLQPRMPALRRSLALTRDEIRRDMQRGSTAHLRQPEASANLFVGLDLALRFAEETGALDRPRADDLRARLRDALQGLARRHAQGLSEIQPAEVFVDVLSTLHTQGKVRLRDLVDDLPSGGEIEMIGWRKGDTALVIPEAAYRRVAMFVREAGDHWAPSLRELHKELVNRGYARATADGRDAGQWRVGPDRKKRRGWLMPLSAFGIGPGPQSASSGPHGPGGDGGSEDEGKQLEFQDERTGDPLLPPMPPKRERQAHCWQTDADE
jgi:5S rRNA maturation endonuclease (ribonuclease M5)